MKRFNFRHLLVALVSLGAISVTACNTIEGVGKDLESAGDKAQEVTRK